MPKSSRHKWHKQSKKDLSSDSEEDVKVKERINTMDVVAASVGVPIDSSHEKRRISSSFQSKVVKDLSNSEEGVSSKVRKDKVERITGSLDRWKAGGDEENGSKEMEVQKLKLDSEKGLKLRESKGLSDVKSKSSSRHESGVVEDRDVGSVLKGKEENRSGSTRSDSKRKSDKDASRREGREQRDTKEKERVSDRESKKIVEKKPESEVRVDVGSVTKKRDSLSEDADKDRLVKRRKENCELGVLDKLRFPESEKELEKVIHRKIEGSNDTDRYRDARENDHMNVPSKGNTVKQHKDERYMAGNHDDRSRLKGAQGRKKTSDKDDYIDLKPRGLKDQRYDVEKRSASDARVEIVTNRGRPGSRYADVEATSIRNRHSPSSSSHATRDQYRSADRHHNNRRNGDPNMVRVQGGSPWKGGLPDWPSPLANVFMPPFPHGPPPPPVGFHTSMQPFPGMRPSMGLSRHHPYPVPDNECHGGWRTPVYDPRPPQLNGWEANDSAINGGDSRFFGSQQHWHHGGPRSSKPVVSKPKVGSTTETLSGSLFSTIGDSLLQKAMSVYRKLREGFVMKEKHSPTLADDDKKEALHSYPTEDLKLLEIHPDCLENPQDVNKVNPCDEKSDELAVVTNNNLEILSEEKLRGGQLGYVSDETYYTALDADLSFEERWFSIDQFEEVSSNGECHTRKDNFTRNADQMDTVGTHTHKRLRKPLQRYIDECNGVLKSGENGGQRKHRILWSMSEVEKLIDGVSLHGVRRWSRIKKELFPSSPHRTRKDLKDKWRNLSKVIHIQRGNKRPERKKRYLVRRPLPESIVECLSGLYIIYPHPSNL